MSLSDALPEWVRRGDGRQVPFDADRICQALFAAGAALGEPNAFLARELTDAVLHFLAQTFSAIVPTTAQIADEVEKIVREVGQPQLARRFAELHRQADAPRPPAPAASPEQVVAACLRAYTLQAIFSSDLRAASDEGLLHLSGLTAPAALHRYVLDGTALGAEAWWFTWAPWKACGERWIMDSPEWLSLLFADRLPIVRLCERIVDLPRAAAHAVELHLNTAEPPSWIHAQGIGPLFAGADNPFRVSHHFGFLDMLLENCLALPAADAPALAWHLHEEAFRDAAQLGRLKKLLRHALQGRAVRFVFDRPAAPITLAEGMDRQCPGVLLEVGLHLPTFVERPDIAGDGATFLKKLPSLARMAVSAAAQKRRYLRRLPEEAPLKRGFLLERAAGNVVPLGLDAVVERLCGASLQRGGLALDFAVRILRTLQDALHQAGRALDLDMRLETAEVRTPCQEPQLSAVGRLHACTGAGTAALLLHDAAEARVDHLAQLLDWTWRETAIVRLQLERAEQAVRQGELMI